MLIRTRVHGSSRANYNSLALHEEKSAGDAKPAILAVGGGLDTWSGIGVADVSHKLFIFRVSNFQSFLVLFLCFSVCSICVLLIWNMSEQGHYWQLCPKRAKTGDVCPKRFQPRHLSSPLLTQGSGTSKLIRVSRDARTGWLVLHKYSVDAKYSGAGWEMRISYNYVAKIRVF